MNELYHYGILGQKWGIRRYQNEDGSYTDAGRKRYGIGLDINDKSRRNVARIRKGEAYRRLDSAKANNPTNTARIAELQGRVRSAKEAEKRAKKIDKGAKLYGKGRTITGNNARTAAGYGAAWAGSNLLTLATVKGLDNLKAQGRIRAGHYRAAQVLLKAGKYSMYGAAIANNVKNNRDNAAIRSYYSSRYSSDSSIKSIGSSEYKDVVNRKKKK